MTPRTCEDKDKADDESSRHTEISSLLFIFPFAGSAIRHAAARYEMKNALGNIRNITVDHREITGTVLAYRIRPRDRCSISIEKNVARHVMSFAAPRASIAIRNEIVRYLLYYRLRGAIIIVAVRDWKMARLSYVITDPSNEC